MISTDGTKDSPLLLDAIYIRGLAEIQRSRLRAKEHFIHQELKQLDVLTKEFDLAVTNCHVASSEMLKQDLLDAVDNLREECEMLGRYLEPANPTTGGDK